MLESLTATVNQLATVILDPDTRPPSDENALTYSNTMRVSDNPAEIQAFRDFLGSEGRAPSSLPALRRWVLDRQIAKTAAQLNKSAA